MSPLDQIFQNVSPRGRPYVLLLWALTALINIVYIIQAVIRKHPIDFALAFALAIFLAHFMYAWVQHHRYRSDLKVVRVFNTQADT